MMIFNSKHIWENEMKIKVTILSLLIFLMRAIVAAEASEQSCGDKSIVILGDSLVAGYGLNPGESFPERLGDALAENGLSINIINAGVSGDTTSGGLSRLDWSVPDGTSGVVLELGANDALRGISPEITESNLKAIIEKLEARNMKVLLAGMLAPPNMGEAYEEKFNPIFKSLAETYGVHFYPFFLEGVAGDPSLNQPDGMHPTAAGIDKIVANFMPTGLEFAKAVCED